MQPQGAMPSSGQTRIVAILPYVPGAGENFDTFLPTVPTKLIGAV
jgi:hypothetical protein